MSSFPTRPYDYVLYANRSLNLCYTYSIWQHAQQAVSSNQMLYSPIEYLHHELERKQKSSTLDIKHLLLLYTNTPLVKKKPYTFSPLASTSPFLSYRLSVTASPATAISSPGATSVGTGGPVKFFLPLIKYQIKLIAAKPANTTLA